MAGASRVACRFARLPAIVGLAGQAVIFEMADALGFLLTLGFCCSLPSCLLKLERGLYRLPPFPRTPIPHRGDDSIELYRGTCWFRRCLPCSQSTRSGHFWRDNRSKSHSLPKSIHLLEPSYDVAPSGDGLGYQPQSNALALRLKSYGVARAHLAGREDRRVDSGALVVPLHDAFQNAGG